MEALGETRARLTDLLLVDAREDPDRWLLRGSVLAAVERVLAGLRGTGTGGGAARPPRWRRRR